MGAEHRDILRRFVVDLKIEDFKPELAGMRAENRPKRRGSSTHAPTHSEPGLS
jgi:hypothetical protein